MLNICPYDPVGHCEHHTLTVAIALTRPSRLPRRKPRIKSGDAGGRGAMNADLDQMLMGFRRRLPTTREMDRGRIIGVPIPLRVWSRLVQIQASQTMASKTTPATRKIAPVIAATAQQRSTQSMTAPAVLNLIMIHPMTEVAHLPL